VSRGRAVAIIVVAATNAHSRHHPDIVADIFSWRFAGRCSTDISSDVILGQGWQPKLLCRVDRSTIRVWLASSRRGFPVVSRSPTRRPEIRRLALYRENPPTRPIPPTAPKRAARLRAA